MASPPLEGRESKLPLSLGYGFHSRVVSEKEVTIKNIDCHAKTLPLLGQGRLTWGLRKSQPEGSDVLLTITPKDDAE